MRISSAQLHEASVRAMTTQQASLVKVAQQVAEGRRVLTPADDPIASSREVALDASLRSSEQMQKNQADVKGQLEQAENYLGQGSTLLSAFKSSIVKAGSGVLSPSDRASVVADMTSLRDQMMSLANTQDESGNFVFAGFKRDSQPFSRTSEGVVYGGDSGIRQSQIGPNRFIDANFSGAYVFDTALTGKSGVVATAGDANMGGLLLTGSTINDKTTWGTEKALGPFNVAFGADGAYTVTDGDGEPYAAGTLTKGAATLDVAGVRLSFSGAPKAGDTLSVSSSTSQSIFDTMDQAIAALSMPESSQESARRGNALFALSANIDGGLDRMLEARTSLGSRLNEVEAALSADSARSDALTEEIARVTGADATSQVELATQLAQRKFSVEAAQLTYTKISQLSIFNYL